MDPNKLTGDIADDATITLDVVDDDLVVRWHDPKSQEVAAAAA
jgi:hypothetical protein